MTPLLPYSIQQRGDAIISTFLFSESVFPFSMSGYWLDDSLFCHLFQKFGGSGRLNINYTHHIRASEDRLTWKCLSNFQNVTCGFRLKLFPNVRFYLSNVRFLYLFKCAADSCPAQPRSDPPNPHGFHLVLDIHAHHQLRRPRTNILCNHVPYHFL